MGNVTSQTVQYPWEWVNGPPGEEGYDDAGYIPPGMTYPHQQSWSEAYNYGGNIHMRFFDYWCNPGNPTLCGIWDWGATEGILTSFGTLGQHYAQLYDTSTPGVLNTFSDGRFASVKQQPKPYATWKGKVCTPETFPNCTMQPMMQAGGEAGFFDHSTVPASRVYTDSVSRAYNNFFLSSGPESLDQVNTSEHSTYDPCDNPTLIELLLPLVTGGALVGVYSYYGKPELSLVIGSNYASWLSVALFSFGYNLAKGLLEYFSEPTNKYTERAVRSLLLPLAIAGGAYSGNWLAQQMGADDMVPYQVGCAGLLMWAANAKLVAPLAIIISSSTFVVAIVLNGLKAITGAFGKWWCRMTTNLDSCEAWDDQDNGLQDSRRWDAVAIASKLTLEVCEREGWKKDDPRAEFVFRGLLTGPALQTAAVVPGNLSNFDQTLVNPLGFIYTGRWQQEPTYESGYNSIPQVVFSRTQNIIGWDGNVAEWSDASAANLYSCENWDIMRDGLQQNTAPGTKQVKRNFDKWVGTWIDPTIIGTLVNAAQIPANIAQMDRIPGFTVDRPVNVLYPMTGLEHPLVPVEFPGALKSLGSASQYCDNLWTDVTTGSSGLGKMQQTEYAETLGNWISAPDFASCYDVNYVKETLQAVFACLTSVPQGQFADWMDDEGWSAAQQAGVMANLTLLVQSTTAGPVSQWVNNVVEIE